MFFISLLILSTLAIAGSAAFFSVYGLAHTFTGTFWSVVVMGGSLEAGKLIGASYLYRYWDKTNIFLKTYLIAGVTTLMLLTSVGIFGYLSAGYQTDALPLKQTKEQISLLEEERTRSIERKRQIDDQISKGAIVSNVQGKDGQIDEKAARTLREATRSRESMNRQFAAEQKNLTARIAELDKQLLALRQSMITAEAKIGPISYIAGVFDLPTDNATKYLIFLIIFAFDPMALALTLAVNIALKERALEKAKPAIVPEDPHPTGGLAPEEPVPTVPISQEAAAVMDDDPPSIGKTKSEQQADAEEMPKMVATAPPGNWSWKGVGGPVVWRPEPEPALRPSPAIVAAADDQQYSLAPQHAARMNSASIKELVDHYKSLRLKETNTPQEKAEIREIEAIFARRGLHGYLN